MRGNLRKCCVLRSLRLLFSPLCRKTFPASRGRFVSSTGQPTFLQRVEFLVTISVSRCTETRPEFFNFGTKYVMRVQMMRESNLLIVEDDMAVRQALTRLLTTENYKVFGASSCREAMLLYRQNQIDVVLLDLNLDHEDGWEVFNQLKELRADLPIFVTSGQPQRFAHSSAHRADGILEKPFDLPALFGLLKHATRPGPILGIPSRRRAMPRCVLPTRRKRPRFEMPMHLPAAVPSAQAPVVKLLIAPYWIFIYPWHVVLYTFRALFHR